MLSRARINEGYSSYHGSHPCSCFRSYRIVLTCGGSGTGGWTSGEDHDFTETAVYDRTRTLAVEQFNRQPSPDIRRNIFCIMSNLTRPEEPFVLSGSVGLRVNDEDPMRAKLSACFITARSDSNKNADLE